MDENGIRNLVRIEFQGLRFTMKSPKEPVTAEEMNRLMDDLKDTITRILIKYDQEKRR